ncbi:MAG: transaldolase [Ilumatobacteraceae bacterium]
MVAHNDLSVKVFADGADLAGIRALIENPLIKGFTTNPTLMRQAGIADYLAFSREVLEVIGDAPISLEVFSDELPEMERQARKLAALGGNVYVKIPITNTERLSTMDLVHTLTKDGIQVNVTAMMSLAQVEDVTKALAGGAPACASIFAGRVADTGVDPLPLMSAALEILSAEPQLELIWASPRDLLNIVQASQIGCHIITVTHDLLKKLPLLGKDLDEYSLDTVKMFASDASVAGYQL